MIRTDNSDDQSRQDSLVLYAADERRQARDVARLLDISRTEQIDEETQALADSSDETGTLAGRRRGRPRHRQRHHSRPR